MFHLCSRSVPILSIFHLFSVCFVYVDVPSMFCLRLVNGLSCYIYDPIIVHLWIIPIMIITIFDVICPYPFSVGWYLGLNLISHMNSSDLLWIFNKCLHKNNWCFIWTWFHAWILLTIFNECLYKNNWCSIWTPHTWPSLASFVAQPGRRGRKGSLHETQNLKLV